MSKKFYKFFRFITSLNEEIILNETYLIANKKYSITLGERKLNYKNIKGKIKEKYSSKGFDLEEEKHIVNTNILYFDKKNDDSYGSACLAFWSIIISMIIPYVYNVENNKIVSEVSQLPCFIIVFFGYMSIMLGYLGIMRYENSNSICNLNFYKLCLKSLEEVEKEKTQIQEDDIKSTINTIAEDVKSIKRYIGIK